MQRAPSARAGGGILAREDPSGARSTGQFLELVQVSGGDGVVDGFHTEHQLLCEPIIIILIIYALRLMVFRGGISIIGKIDSEVAWHESVASLIKDVFIVKVLVVSRARLAKAVWEHSGRCHQVARGEENLER